MKAYSYRQVANKLAHFPNLFFLMLILTISSKCLAGPIVISGNQVINSPTVYQNVVLDMSNGRFTVTPGGSLKIENSTINVTISPANTYMVSMMNGNLVFSNNLVKVSANSITPNPHVKSSYQLIQIQNGDISINDNVFENNTAYTVGFLQTQTNPTNGFIINHNAIKNFHGGIYLINSKLADVSNNTFEFVSFANIFNMQSDASKINGNIFSFPGNLVEGDAIDIINSKGLTVSDNIVESSSGYGIFIMGGQKLFIENNQISNGMSYGIFISAPSVALARKNAQIMQFFTNNKLTLIDNSNIVINNNYIGQNRYGLAGGDVDHLNVTNNIFIQRFLDNSTRQYWTNNDVLLPSATDLSWLNNLYKEAFTQEVPGDNSNTLKFVPFPAHGGVFLP